jgi:hypothetical protein
MAAGCLQTVTLSWEEGEEAGSAAGRGREEAEMVFAKASF